MVVLPWASILFTFNNCQGFFAGSKEAPRPRSRPGGKAR